MAGVPPVTEVAGRPEALDQALERLRLEGAIFLRAEYSESWTLEGQGGPMFAAMMHPGAERLVLFHVIASGRCWVALPGGERYWASAGEVIVLPYGDEFLMGGVEAATPVHIASVVPLPPWTEMPVIRYGGGGDRTDVVDASIQRTRCSIRAGPRSPRRSWFGRRTGPQGTGSTRASHTHWKNRQASHRLADQQSSLSCSSPKRSGCISRRPPQWSAAGSLGYAIPCSDSRWPRSTQLRNEDGRLTTLLPRPGCHARGSTVASARFSDVRRSAISTNGGCTWRKTCWRPRTPRSRRSPTEWDTTRKRRSAERSNARTDGPQPCGAQLGRTGPHISDVLNTPARVSFVAADAQTGARRTIRR